jgi:hypothetical protein
MVAVLGALGLETVCSMPEGCNAFAATADGHVAAFWPQSDGRLRFVWDGVAGDPFDGLVEMRDKSAAIFVSPDGAHLAYVGLRGGRGFVGRDGGEDASFGDFSRSVPPVFSHDGGHLGYGVIVGDDGRLVLDGQIVGDAPLAPIEVVFSADGVLAFVEMRAAPDGGHDVRIVLDGHPGEWFRGMRNARGAMQFSPDGRRFASYRIDTRGHGQWVIDGVPMRLVNDAHPVSLARMRGVGVLDPPLVARFSPDGSRFAWFADLVDGGVAIAEDDLPGPSFKAVGKPVFSPDSRRLAYVAQTLAGTWTLVVDGRPTDELRSTDAGVPVFSPDSRHVAVALCHDEGGVFRRRHLVRMIQDGAPLLEVPGDVACQHVVFSPDGQRLGWWVQTGPETTVMVDLDRVATVGQIVGYQVFTASGLLAFAATTPGKSATVYLDGLAGPRAEELLLPRTARMETWSVDDDAPITPFAVSPDGGHVCWAGRFADGVRPVVDDRVGPILEDIIAWDFDASGVARWWVRQGDTISIATL